MKIIVIGCGKVGSALARQLSEEGHDVSVIDRNPEVVNEVTSSCDVIGIVGNGGSHAVQKEVGIEDADLLIAASDSDELNLLSCLIAKKAGNCSTIARVRNPIYNSEIGFIREELGLSLTVNPEYAAAMEASRLLKFPSAIKIEPFARGHIELLKFPISGNSPIGGHTLAEVTKNIGGDVLVCAVERGPEHNVTIPDGLFRLQAGDILSIIAGPKSAHAFVEKAGLKSRSVSNCMIIGGGTIAYYLARILLDSHIDVTIIEKKPEVCKMLAEELPEANIICGDAANQNVLLEEKIESMYSQPPEDRRGIYRPLCPRDGKFHRQQRRDTLQYYRKQGGGSGIPGPGGRSCHRDPPYAASAQKRCPGGLYLQKQAGHYSQRSDQNGSGRQSHRGDDQYRFPGYQGYSGGDPLTEPGMSTRTSPGAGHRRIIGHRMTGNAKVPRVLPRPEK